MSNELEDMIYGKNNESTKITGDQKEYWDAPAVDRNLQDVEDSCKLSQVDRIENWLWAKISRADADTLDQLRIIDCLNEKDYWQIYPSAIHAFQQNHPWNILHQKQQAPKLSPGTN
jgi:hypothetical protein